jgi:nucleotide-binding universal stress UspA family protein
MAFHKILCPTDFSPGSQQALRTAIRIASRDGAELVLAHAWQVPPVIFASELIFSPEVLGELSAGAQAGLDAAAREARELGATRLTPRLLDGMPRHAIAALLEADPAIDLVVMGTHGRTGLGRILLGSVAESVARHAPCSVLAVRPDAAIGPFARVLCPIDFSHASQHALDLAAELAEADGGALALLNVIDPPAVYAGAERTAELARDLDRYASAHLEQWAARLAGKTRAPVTKLSRVGHPGAEILAALDAEPPFDLIVVGSHGRIGVDRMLLGSVAEKVVRHARCAVLVARRPGA